MDDVDYRPLSREHVKRQRKQLMIFIVVTLILAILAFVVGYVARPKARCSNSQGNDGNYDESLHKNMVDSLTAKNIEDNLLYFAEKPHLASDKRNTELIHKIYRRFKSYGFNATYHPYKVLLAFPNSKKRNKVSIIDEKGNASYTSKGIEDFLEASEKIAKDYPSFNGYAPSGTAEGELVYANYGRLEDFVELENKYRVNVSGKIVIARYGKIFRGSKVLLAQQRGAIGVILYSDPFDAAPEGEKFIKGRWLPDDGIQRGSILNINGGGDPLTLGYPSKDWAYHADVNMADLPKIPAQPVSALDAFNLMKDMGGPKADEGWVGLLNISYSIGPYIDNKAKVKLEVFNYRELRTITNVCGTVPGKIEPDRYVILGNHVDAWVFGGVDPSSGTSVMMEIARVVGDKVKTGWRPRRTIKFCGWDGEEYGLIGSSEFVEEYRSQFRDRAVAYINVDSAVSGNESLRCAGSPLLKKMMIEVHKEVEDPFDKNMTVFDRSKSTQPDKNYLGEHRIGSLGSGSDYTAFYQFLGVPSLDVSYQQVETNKRLKISSYPVYHSLHDTYYWIKHFVDKDFTVHLTVARVVMSYLLRLADSLVLPYDVQRYGERLHRDALEFQVKLKKETKRKDIEKLADRLMNAAQNFTTAYKAFAEQKNAADLSDPLQLRMWNDRLIQLEKGFIYVDGLPGRSTLKHYIMAPSKYNAYGSTTFPAISDALYEANETGDWDQVKKQISITAYLIQNVADTLKSVT